MKTIISLALKILLFLIILSGISAYIFVIWGDNSPLGDLSILPLLIEYILVVVIAGFLGFDSTPNGLPIPGLPSFIGTTIGIFGVLIILLVISVLISLFWFWIKKLIQGDHE